MSQAQPSAAPDGPIRVFVAFLRLGLTSFGGPVAHIVYFREAFVTKRQWLGEAAYADLVALCQFLPGPASSQVGIGLGLMRAGIPGAFAAWLGFTLPSVVLMTAFAFGAPAMTGTFGSGWLGGLMAAVVAVVGQAVWLMARTLCPDAPRLVLAAVGGGVALSIPGPAGQMAAIGLGALAGLTFGLGSGAGEGAPAPVSVSRRTGFACLVIFVVLLAGLPLLAAAWPTDLFRVVDGFFRSGALVFGGGHVMLPLLQGAMVEPGWVAADAFIAGYGAAQAVPGPLSSFAAYLGATMTAPPGGITGAILGTVAIFAPSFLLVIGAVPFWAALRAHTRISHAFAGINAAVVGLLLAALWNPVISTGIRDWPDVVLAALALVALQFLKWPSWAVVGLAALGGWGITQI
ncbi:MAG: chromate efflux transporter [Rhodospirillaceae bacterium]|nr:chromate efflux transporter [Rhodospirillaceae bacterium]